MSTTAQQTPTTPAHDAGWLTLPNAVTLVRFALLLPVAWLLADGPETLSVVLLLVWALTDWVDGALARALNQTSRVGAIIDPIADRIGLAGIILALAFSGLLPWGALITIGVVDILTALLAGRAAARGRMHVSLLGKARTAVLMIGLFGLCAAAAWLPPLVPAAVVVVWAGVGLHLLAGAGYVLAARRLPRQVGSTDQHTVPPSRSERDT